ncbi:MAG: multidrug effflux MFS transporter [Selenomonadaceae bacterium]
MIDISSKQNIFIFLLFLIGFLLGIGIDLYVPALPVISQYYTTPQSSVQLSISLYMLGYGASQIFFGILSDAWGRRKILLAASAAYTVISFSSIFAPTMLCLNILRLLQGVSVGGLAVVARALLVDCFSGAALLKASSWFGLSWSLGPILGPFIGSLLQTYFSWQTDFFFFAVYGLLLFAIILLKVPETSTCRQPMDLRQAYHTIKSISFQSIFFRTTLIGGIGYSIIVLFNILGPFLLEDSLGVDPLTYGYIALGLGLAYFFGCTVNRLISQYCSLDKMLLISMAALVCISAGMLITAILFPFTANSLVLPIGFMFFSCGFTVPCSLAKTMQLFPQHAGVASSIFGALSGLVVFSLTFFARFLPTNTQIPLSCTYLSLSLLGLLLLSGTLSFVSKHTVSTNRLCPGTKNV